MAKYSLDMYRRNAAGQKTKPNFETLDVYRRDQPAAKQPGFASLDMYSRKKQMVQPDVDRLESGTTEIEKERTVIPRSTTVSVPSYDTDWENWYRRNTGTDYAQGAAFPTEGISAGEQEVGANLLDYYRQKQVLDDEKSRALQRASITYDKLKYYLPMQQRAAGLGGNIGVTESAMLDAAARYNNDAGEISLDYAKDAAALESYKNAKTQDIIDKYRQKEEDALYDEYNSLRAAVESGRYSTDDLDRYLSGDGSRLKDWQAAVLVGTAEAKEKEKKEAEQDRAYQELRDIIDYGHYNDPAELRTYLGSISDIVSESQYRTLDQMVKAKENDSTERLRRESEKTAEAEKEAYKIITKDKREKTFRLNKNNTGHTDYRKGDNFEIKDSDNTIFYIQSGGQETDQNVLDLVKQSGMDNDTVFMSNNQLYLYHNGKVYLIEERDLSHGEIDNLYNLFRGDPEVAKKEMTIEW